MKWIRREEIGRGEYGRVCKAFIPESESHGSDLPSLVAVKSCFLEHSMSPKKEKTIMHKIGVCPQIIRCYGGGKNFENGKELYNLLLGLAPGGTLADRAGRLTEGEILRHTRTILQGLAVIHDRGFVHCDIKPHNILVSRDGDAKIADFGLVKLINKKISSSKQNGPRGTPQYIAPESVKEDEYEPPWMFGHSFAWWPSCPRENHHGATSGAQAWPLLMRIAADDDLPLIPTQLSDQRRDFVGKCLIKDPRKRWTVSMLLNHAFVNPPQ